MSSQTVEKAEKKSILPKIIIGLVILAIVCGGVFFYLNQSAQKRVVKFLHRNGVSYASLDVDWKGRFVAHDIKTKVFNGIDTTISTISGDVASSGLKSRKLVLKDISYQLETTKVLIPLVTLEGYSVKPQASGSGSKSGATNADSLFDISDIDIKKATIPSVTMEQDSNGIKQKVLYKAITYDDVKQGVVKTSTIESSALDSQYSEENAKRDGIRSISVKAGKTVNADISLPNLVNYYTKQSTALDETNPYKSIVGPWSADNIAFTIENVEDPTINGTIDQITGTTFTTRLLPFSLLTFSNELDALDTDVNSDPAKQAALGDKGLQLLAAVGAADIQFHGLKIADKEIAMSTDSLALSYGENGFNTSMSGLLIATEDAHIKLQEFAVNDMRFPEAMDALKKLNALSIDPTSSDKARNKAISDVSGLAFVPRFKNIHLKGLDIDVKTQEDSTTSGKMKLDSLDVDADYALAAIPTSLRIVMNGMQTPASDIDDSLLFSLPGAGPEIWKSLGYDVINTDMTFDAAWNKDSQQLDIKELSYKLQDMGSVVFKGTLSNASEALFSENSMTMAAAAIGLRAQNIDMSVNVDGILNRYAKQQDETAQADFAEQRRQAAMQARMAIALFLGAERSQQIGEGLQSFIENGGTLNVHAKAKSENGLSLLDIVMAESNPLLLLEKIDLSADTQH